MPITNLLQQLTIRPLFRIGLPLLAFVLVFAIGTHNAHQARPSYRASARIWVQKTFFGGGHGAQPGEIPESPLVEGASNLQTFAEVIQSDAVLGLAYEELKTTLPQDKLLPRAALGSIRAIPAKDANIITIEFRWSDPEVPPIVIKSVIHALMKENSMQISGPLEETRQRLEKQLEIARKEYDDAKSQLKEFKKRNDSIDFQAESSGVSAAREDLEAQISEANNELKALNTKVAFLQQQLGFGPDDVLAVEKLSNDEVVNNLKSSIAKTEVQLIEMRSKFQDEHPKVKRLKSILDDAKKEMANRYSVLIGKVDPKFDGISANSEVQHQLLDDMVEARTDIVAGESKVGSLEESLQAMNQQITSFPAKQEELSNLQRLDELATNTLAAVESELQRVKLTESVSLSSSRLQCIDSVQFTESGSAINQPILLLISLVAAAIVAAVQYMLDPRLHSMAHVRAIGLRVVGWFPKTGGTVEEAIPFADRLRMQVKNWISASKVIWITSANEAEGKSLIAHALAESCADSGLRVALLDANFNHPSLHLSLGVPGSPGLLQMLGSDEKIKMVEIRPNLHFVAAGGVTNNLRLLSGAEFKQIIESLEQKFDVILVDGPAAGSDECALQLCDDSPNLLVVVRMRHAMRASVNILKNQIQVLPLSEVGLVLNSVSVKEVAQVGKDLASPTSTTAPAPAGQAAEVAEVASSQPATAAW